MFTLPALNHRQLLFFAMVGTSTGATSTFGTIPRPFWNALYDNVHVLNPCNDTLSVNNATVISDK